MVFVSQQRHEIVLCYKMCRPGLGPLVVTAASFPTGTAYRTVKLTATFNPVPVLRMCGAKPPFPMYLRGVLLNLNTGRILPLFEIIHNFFNTACVLVSDC